MMRARATSSAGAASGADGPTARGRRRAARPVLVALLVVLAHALPGCRTAIPPDDIRIEAEIKARLVAEKGANLTRLGVQSTGGVVYLSGPVPSGDQRARAEEIAREVSGVRRVVNAVEVRDQRQ
jgi:hyperosmotically inducible protein